MSIDRVSTALNGMPEHQDSTPTLAHNRPRSYSAPAALASNTEGALAGLSNNRPRTPTPTPPQTPTPTPTENVVNTVALASASDISRQQTPSPVGTTLPNLVATTSAASPTPSPVPSLRRVPLSQLTPPRSLSPRLAIPSAESLGGASIASGAARTSQDSGLDESTRPEDTTVAVINDTAEASSARTTLSENPEAQATLAAFNSDVHDANAPETITNNIVHSLNLDGASESDSSSEPPLSAPTTPITTAPNPLATPAAIEARVTTATPTPSATTVAAELAIALPHNAPTASANFAQRLFGNQYGPGEALKGWGANVVNAFSHELAATGGATAFREAVSTAAEAIIVKTGATAETRGAIVATLFTVAVLGNLMAAMHKFSKGTASKTTYGGHAAQVIALLVSVTTAGVVGRNQDGNGKLGLLSTLLPAALKSYAYLSRDVFNLMYPLKGNHDADYTKAMHSQFADTPGYFANQETVNVTQSAADLSGAGFADGLIDHSLKIRDGIKDLSGYVLANAAGEGLAGIGARLAAEVAQHGFSATAAQQISQLRLQWGKIDTSKQGGWSQYADKAAGAQIARLSLFLSLYALSACIDHALSGSNHSQGWKNNAENAIGALLIVAGCLPFAMSTTEKAPTRIVELDEESALESDGDPLQLVRMNTALQPGTPNPGNAPSTSGSAQHTPRTPPSAPSHLAPNTPSGHARGPSFEIA